MATATLSRFTVKLPTNQSASAQGLLMPKLQYRFRASFIGLGVSADSVELTKQVASFSRPTVNFGDIDIHVYNSIVKLAGKPTWENVTVTLRDDASGLVSRLIGEQLQKQFDFYEQSSAAAGIDYKFQVKCEVLDGGNGAFEPQILETWELAGCYIQQANYQELNYQQNDPVTIQLSIRFDNAIQSPGGTGVGTNVGRALGSVATG